MSDEVIQSKAPPPAPFGVAPGLWTALWQDGLWDANTQAHDGPGPWEIRPYAGPTAESLASEPDLYRHLVKQHQANERRRIQLRLREIDRYTQDKPWAGAIPSAAEIRWLRWVEADRHDKRRKRLAAQEAKRQGPAPKKPKTEPSEVEQLLQPICLETAVVPANDSVPATQVVPEAEEENPIVEWPNPYESHAQVVAWPTPPPPEEEAEPAIETTTNPDDHEEDDSVLSIPLACCV